MDVRKLTLGAVLLIIAATAHAQGLGVGGQGQGNVNANANPNAAFNRAKEAARAQAAQAQRQAAQARNQLRADLRQQGRQAADVARGAAAARASANARARGQGNVGGGNGNGNAEFRFDTSAEVETGDDTTTEQDGKNTPRRWFYFGERTEEETQAEFEQRVMFQRRMANIARMRDRAIETGDEQLLALADRLEAELRAKATTTGWANRPVRIPIFPVADARGQAAAQTQAGVYIPPPPPEPTPNDPMDPMDPNGGEPTGGEPTGGESTGEPTGDEPAPTP